MITVAVKYKNLQMAPEQVGVDPVGVSEIADHDYHIGSL